MKYSINVILILLMTGCLETARAQNGTRDYRGIGSSAETGRGEKRVALIIGNGTYDVPELSLNNPVNDAFDMSSKLRNLRFDVIDRKNLNKRSLESQFEDLPSLLNDVKVFLFYYAGHGIQVDGENYLVPVDATISKTEEIKERAVNLRLLLTKLQGQSGGNGKRVNIIILDACRNNPFNITDPPTRDFSGRKVILSKAQGLAGIDISMLTNTLIAYSTHSDSLASDGSGRNGLYTASLLAEIDRQGGKLDEVFKRVRAEVERKSNNKQIPWELSSLKEDFYFNGPEPGLRSPPDRSSELASDGRWIVTARSSFELRTSQPLFDTGLVIQAGMSVTIKIGVGGKYNLGGNEYSGPAGVSLADSSKPASHCQTGAVIARIGNDYYCVKTGFDRIIQTTGPLWLGINESNLADNSGSFTATVQLQQLQRH